MSKIINAKVSRFWQVVNTVMALLIVAGIVGMFIVAKEAAASAARITAIKDNVNRNTAAVETQRKASEEIGKDIREIKTILKRIEGKPPKPASR